MKSGRSSALVLVTLMILVFQGLAIVPVDASASTARATPTPKFIPAPTPPRPAPTKTPTSLPKRNAYVTPLPPKCYGSQCGHGGPMDISGFDSFQHAPPIDIEYEDIEIFGLGGGSKLR